MTNIDRAIDIGIITIVPVEVDALFKYLGIKREDYEVAVAGSPFQYWRTTCKSNLSSRSLSVVVSILSGDAGNTEAAITTAQFLRDWYPKIMCLIGIAAGIEGKVRIADVVIPNKIHDRTVKVFENGVYRVRSRSYSRNELIDRMFKVSPLSLDDFLSTVHDSAKEDLDLAIKKAKEKKLTKEQFNPKLRIIDGSIASDNVLIKDNSYFNSIVDSIDEKCRGSEMEAAGFVLACQKERIDFPWVLFRGISDFGDDTKDDSFQLLAAKAACISLNLFIEKCLSIDSLPHNPRAVSLESTLEFNLVRQINNAYSAKRWKEVCLIGEALSRPLWLMGHLALRYEIGNLVDNAAEYSNNLSLRARTLIDDLGWTGTKLGYKVGEKYIRDGIRLAQECSDHYAVAKGYRHLASICRQKGEPDEAEVFLTKAREQTKQIDDDEQRDEMYSALLVSSAKLHIEHFEYQEAINVLNTALQSFRDTGDTEREIKIYAQLAFCEEKLGNSNKSQQLYLHGRNLARDAGRFDEFSQNTKRLIEIVGDQDPSWCISLAQEVYHFALSHGLWDEAKRWNDEYQIYQDVSKKIAEEQS